MICVVIKGPSLQAAKQQILAANPYADLLELRLDYITDIDLTVAKGFQDLQELCQNAPPQIFTLRSKEHGGKFMGHEADRRQILLKLAALQPAYLDIETHVHAAFTKSIISQHPNVKVILSYHNFKSTPQNLEEILANMQMIPAWAYKIATMSSSCIDTLKLLIFAQQKAATTRLIPIAMGMHGQISRILSPMVANSFTYASIGDEQNYEGQISAKTLIEKYNYKKINPRTAIYGLLGYPVSLSISDVTHNNYFRAQHIDAVYVKIDVPAPYLKEFLWLAHFLPFSGFSVTMPLKESCAHLIDKLSPVCFKIGAINTLIKQENGWFGLTTDGIGALNAIESLASVKNKRVVIIGAGGSAKAIADECVRRGAILTILNRHAAKAHAIADPLNAKSGPLEEMHAMAISGYDILINTTPVSMPIDPLDILPKSIVMDIKTKPKETGLLKEAQKRGCQVIYGYQMFIEQAIGQFDVWFKDSFCAEECRKILQQSITL